VCDGRTISQRGDFHLLDRGDLHLRSISK
jgi:hypothetical protein